MPRSFGNEELRRIISDNIRDEIVTSGKTRSEIAKAIGVSMPTFRSICPAGHSLRWLRFRVYARFSAARQIRF